MYYHNYLQFLLIRSAPKYYLQILHLPHHKVPKWNEIKQKVFIINFIFY